MGTVREKLAGTRIELSTPDGSVTGALRTIDDLAIEVRDGGLRHYSERGLENQLSALIERLWTDYRRSRLAVVAEANGRSAGPLKPWRAEFHQYHTERYETFAEGMSLGQRVFVSGTGLRRCSIVIRDGSLSEMDETVFADEVTSGYAAMMRDWNRKLCLLRARHFRR